MCNESKDKSKPVIDPEEDDQAEELSLQVSYPAISRNFITIAIIAQFFFFVKNTYVFIFTA